MTETEIAEAEAACAKATPGEWIADNRGGGLVRGGPVQHYVRGSGQNQVALATGAEWMTVGEQNANAAFIALSRTALPAALAMIRELQADNKDAATQINDRDQVIAAQMRDNHAQAAEIARLKAALGRIMYHTADAESDGGGEMSAYREARAALAEIEGTK